MRVSIKDVRKYPWFLQPLFRAQKKHYGEVLKSGLVWALSPRLFTGIAVLYGAIDRKKSPIDPVIRSLVTVRVSQINYCAFCVDLNSMTLAKRSGAMDKVDALEQWRDSDLYSEKEKLALEYAEAMTYSDRRVEDELVDRLKKHFDDEALVELTGLVAFQNLSSKFNEALDIEPQGFCKLPDAPSDKERTA